MDDGLKKNFSNASVSVVDCPDLTQKPFMLASPGIWCILNFIKMYTGTHIILSARQNLCINLDSKYWYVQKQLKNSILWRYIQYLVLMTISDYWNKIIIISLVHVYHHLLYILCYIRYSPVFSLIVFIHLSEKITIFLLWNVRSKDASRI